MLTTLSDCPSYVSFPPWRYYKSRGLRKRWYEWKYNLIPADSVPEAEEALRVIEDGGFQKNKPRRIRDWLRRVVRSVNAVKMSQ